MKQAISKHKEWWERREIRLAKSILDLLLFYVFGSLAIDSGSYWHYLAAVLFAGFGVWSLVCALRNK